MIEPMDFTFTKLVPCQVCRGRGTDGNGRICEGCKGVGEMETKIAYQTAAAPPSKSGLTLVHRK